MSRRMFFAMACLITSLLSCANANAQLVEAARIEILPSSTPSVSDRVIARINWDQLGCYSFTSAVTAQPGGVFEVRVTPLTAVEIFPCTQSFDVDLGVLPQGNYSVVFYVAGAVLATSGFTVGAVAIPALGVGGIGALAITLALTAILVGAKARREVGSNALWTALILSGAIVAGMLGIARPVVAADVFGGGIATDLIVRFDRRVEARPVSEIVDSVNGRRDFALSSRLLGPSYARRLIRRDPTEYERNIIAKYPAALVSQMFEYIVLTYDSARDLQALAESLRLSSAVESVERVQVIKRASVDPLLGAPSDSSDNSQWALHALSLPSAWPMTKGRATIAYLDSGLETGHEDLASNFRAHLSRNVTFSFALYAAIVLGAGARGVWRTLPVCIAAVLALAVARRPLRPSRPSAGS